MLIERFNYVAFDPQPLSNCNQLTIFLSIYDAF